MARIRITGLIAMALVGVGSWFIVQSLYPQIQGLITPILGGSWMVMALVGFALVIAAVYIGKR